MRNPFTYLTSETPSQPGDWKSLTPSFYISNTLDLADKYQVGGPESLKHFKIRVEPIKSGSGLLSLDTFDLYYKADHTKKPPAKTELNFNKSFGEGPGSPLRGTPLRFQKVHFRGQAGTKQGGQSEGEQAIPPRIDEYYAIFLVSDPVKISQDGYGLGGGYRDEQCNAFGSQIIVQNEDAEQKDSTAKQWIPEKKDGSSEGDEDPFLKRIIISDSLESQFRDVPLAENTTCVNCDSADDCNIYLIGSHKENHKPVKIDPKDLSSLIDGSGGGGSGAAPCYTKQAEPPSKIVTDIYTSGPDIIVTFSECTGLTNITGGVTGLTWTTYTKTFTITVDVDVNCEDVKDCFECDPCDSGSGSGSGSGSSYVMTSEKISNSIDKKFAYAFLKNYS